MKRLLEGEAYCLTGYGISLSHFQKNEVEYISLHLNFDYDFRISYKKLKYKRKGE
ncbi:MAG: hypothetical protein LBK06_07715 [Planctomycetaceae bacterium]|nr:hypothetical protein [Planctomycetaceae bacterium]